MTALDDAVVAMEAWDASCLHEGLRKPGNAESRCRVLGVRVGDMIEALHSLADLHGLDWHQLQHDATAHRRAGAHVRDALMAACASGLGSGFGPSSEVAKRKAAAA